MAFYMQGVYTECTDILKKYFKFLDFFILTLPFIVFLAYGQVVF